MEANVTAWLNIQKYCPGLQNSEVAFLRDCDSFLEKKWLCLDFECLRLVFFKVFLISVENETFPGYAVMIRGLKGQEPLDLQCLCIFLQCKHSSGEGLQNQALNELHELH